MQTKEGQAGNSLFPDQLSIAWEPPWIGWIVGQFQTDSLPIFDAQVIMKGVWLLLNRGSKKHTWTAGERQGNSRRMVICLLHIRKSCSPKNGFVRQRRQEIFHGEYFSMWKDWLRFSMILWLRGGRNFALSTPYPKIYGMPQCEYWAEFSAEVQIPYSWKYDPAILPMPQYHEKEKGW